MQTNTNDRLALAAYILGGLAQNSSKSDDELVDRARRLADKLLVDLPSTKSTANDENSEAVWQCFSFVKPSVNQPCWVVVWDSEITEIKSVNRFYWWNGRSWEDNDGNYVLGDVPDLQIYWFPSHLLRCGLQAVRYSFTRFITNHLDLGGRWHQTQLAPPPVQPNEGAVCWLISWDESTQQAKGMKAVWRGKCWWDLSGRPITITNPYWQPINQFENVEAAELDFWASRAD